MKRLVAPVALFGGLLAVYLGNRSPLLGNDSKPARYAVVSLLKRGDLDLNEFADEFVTARGLPYYVVEGRGGRIVSRFGPGSAVAAVPVFAPALLVGGGRLGPVAAVHLAKLAASLYAAGAALLLFGCAQRLGASRGRALLVALVYGLCTPALSVASQALWQHAPAQFFLALGFTLLARQGRASTAASGAAFAAAVVCRPADVVFALVALGFVAWRRREALLGFVLCALPLAAAQLAYNAWYLGSPLRFAQAVVVSSDVGAPESAWSRAPWVGFAGLLVSPSRGLFVYSPLFLLLLRRPLAVPPLVKVGLLGAAALLVESALYYRWWGGWCFGPRLLADAAPALSLALLPVLDGLGGSRARIARFALLAAASLAVHLAGAYLYDPFGWDRERDVDAHPARLWSLRDSQLGHTFGELRLRPPLVDDE